MSSPLLLPDAEIIVRQYLLDVDDVMAQLAGDERVATKDPSDTTLAWVQLARVGGTRRVRQGLDAALVDINCFAPDEIEAGLLARSCLAALLEARNAQLPAGTLAGVDEAVGLRTLTDSSRTPPADRQTFSITAFIRPT